MRRTLLIALLSGVLTPAALPAGQQISGAAPEPPADAAVQGRNADEPEADAAARPPDPESYAALVERIRSGDRAVDFTRLRMAFTETPEYRGAMMAVYQALWRPLAQGNFAQAIAVADKVLAENFVEVNAHMVASLAYAQTGEPMRAAFHRDVASGLLRSIQASGDGLTPETPFDVIDISEQYATVRSLNLQPKSVGSSFDAGSGSVLDSLTAVDPRTGETRVIYFRVKTTPRPGGPALPR